MRFLWSLLGLLMASAAQAQAQAVAPAPSSPVTFPAPRYTPAGAGAPTVGQPGELAAPVARSPNTRVLPPTDEPGLWAADEPRAARRPLATPQPDIDELLLPRASPGTPELLSCRQRVLRASKATGLEEMRRNLPRTPRGCVTARLLLHCANREFKEFELMAQRTPRLEGANPVVARRQEVEQTFYWQMRVCESFRSLPDIEELVSEIVAALERQFRSVK